MSGRRAQESMRPERLLRTLVLSCALAAFGAAAVRAAEPPNEDALLEQLLSLERAALDRWIRLDPAGYLELYATDVTYFDPSTETRVDGLTAMEQRLAPMKNVKLPFADVRYEIITPRVQRLGAAAAVLTFNVVNYGRRPNEPETVISRWNSTAVYSRADGRWKIVHSHWSFVKGAPTAAP